MPDRITLSRAKGWRKPEGAIVVARPSIWGNPFTVAQLAELGWRGKDPARFVVECFDNWLRGDRQHWMGAESDAAADTILSRLHELRGHALCCWCKPGQPCHADVLLRLANKEALKS